MQPFRVAAMLKGEWRRAGISATWINMLGLGRHNFASVVIIYAVAVMAGYAASWLGVPLPWMIGPMVAAGALSALTSHGSVPKFTRPVGQIIVAGIVGLAFTPAAVTAVGQQIVPMIAVALLTIVAGFLAAAVLMRLTHMDIISASLACIPGGPVEMAALATRYGVAPGPVGFAQTLRIALLVLVIPPILLALDGSDRSGVLDFMSGDLDYAGGALLLGLAAVGGFVFRVLRVSSPFFLGPLAFAAVATALALPVSMPPLWVLATGQVLLGVWLGCMFDREMLAKSRGFIPAAFLSTFVLMVLCAAMALGVSAMTGMDWRTMILATAPGSVTEMALTAKILQQGVAMVTAFHVVRIFILLPLAPLIFSVTARLAKRFARDAEG
jgi:uncharacterized protein